MQVNGSISLQGADSIEESHTQVPSLCHQNLTASNPNVLFRRGGPGISKASPVLTIEAYLTQILGHGCRPSKVVQLDPASLSFLVCGATQFR